MTGGRPLAEALEMEHGVGVHDTGRAQPSWEKMQRAAVESLDWESLIEAGRASLRLVGAGGRAAAERAARRAFFTALHRACRENSLEGILRAAEAFDDLGDREIVEECVGLAELQAEGEPTRRRVAAFVERLALARASLRTADAADTIGAAQTNTTLICGREEP